jgi:hypothetical protein
MNEELIHRDLFDSKLSASGKLFIRKFASLTQTLMVFGIIISALIVIQAIVRFIRFKPEIFNALPLMKLQYTTYPYVAVISSIILLLQVFYYRKAGKLLSESVNDGDEEKFNSSFSYLYRNAVVSIGAFILSILLYSFDLFITLKYWP